MNAPSDLPLPDPSIHPVGRNKSRAPGQMQLALLRHCGLTPSSDLLEIGCGIGRLVYELANFTCKEATYLGFDIAHTAIDWLNAHYAPRLPNFQFHLVDATNTRYRPKASQAPNEVTFPANTEAFDMVCAFSVFTHMRWPDIRRYLDETRRVLRSNGTGVLTFFALREEEKAPSLPGHGQFIQMDNLTWTTDLQLPERAIAFPERHITSALKETGFDVKQVRPGFWRNQALKQELNPPFHKDVFVVSPT